MNKDVTRRAVVLIAISLIVSALLAIMFWIAIKFSGQKGCGIHCLRAVILVFIWGVFSVAYCLFGIPILRRLSLPLVFLIFAALYGLLYTFAISPLSQPLVFFAYSYRITPYFGACAALLLILKFKTACCIQFWGLFTGIFWGELIGGFTGYSIWRMYMDIFNSESEIVGFSEGLGLGIIWGVGIFFTLISIGYEIHGHLRKKAISNPRHTE